MQNLNIVFVGNSITYGAGLQNPETEAPPVHASAYLMKQPGIGKVNYSNQGRSGYTTVDFLPSGDTFKFVEEAANNFQKNNDGLLIFSIILGTNDSAVKGPLGSPVSPDSYQQNLKTIANRLLKDYPECKIVFQHPLWYSPNTYNGAIYLQEGLDRLISYFPKIDALVKSYAVKCPGRVFLGDTQAFMYYKKHYLTELQPEHGNQGIFYLHPNKKGAENLGYFWAKAIFKAIK
ncbi:MAG: GDSL-type esterase/lipase family protein [Bacteroidota bacterium]|nr:GDSL-type esterase/lipase family protein [Bacteroidota bacterium]